MYCGAGGRGGAVRRGIILALILFSSVTMNGPYNIPADNYIYAIAICSSLALPCNNTWNVELQACASPNTAAVCQEQQAGSNSACCGQFKSLDASIFSNATDSGITLKYIDGDACDVCDPVPRDTQLTVVCDPSYTAVPTVWEISGAAVPSPTYHIKLRHASGCAIGGGAPVSPPAQAPVPVAEPVGPAPQPEPEPAPEAEPVAVPAPNPEPVPTPSPVCTPPQCPFNQCAGTISNPCGSPIPCNNVCFGKEQCINNFCTRPTPPPVAQPNAAPDSSGILGPVAASGWSVESILLIIMISLLAVVLLVGAPVLCCIYVKVRRVEDSESRPFFHWPIKSPQSRYNAM